MRKLTKLETIPELPEEDLKSSGSEASASSSEPAISGSLDVHRSGSSADTSKASGLESKSQSSVSSSEWNAYYPPWVRYEPKGLGRRRKKKSASAPSSSSTKPELSLVRVKNLSDDAQDEDVWDIFKKFGNIKSVSIYYDVFGRSTGTADVFYTRRQFAEAAVTAIQKCGDIEGQKNLRAKIIHRDHQEDPEDML